MPVEPMRKMRLREMQGRCVLKKHMFKSESRAPFAATLRSPPAVSSLSAPEKPVAEQTDGWGVGPT